MKRSFFTLLAAGITAAASAQTVAGGDMETWRTGTAGAAPAVAINAPVLWFGLDSLAISEGELFSSDTTFAAQLFRETDSVHTGSSAARLLTLRQGGFGYIGGILSNARIDVDIPAVIGGADPLTALIYTGGTPTSLRTQTVSAWVKYTAGIDGSTGMWGGTDTGSLMVQAVHTIAPGIDSVIGTGTADILPSAGFTQITAHIVYADTFYTTTSVRIIFSSSKLGGEPADSSTLYVDDVTMAGVPQTGGPLPNGVHTVTGGAQAVSLYPNPAANTLYLSSPGQADLTATILTASGQVVATQALSGTDAIDIHNLAAGLYIYTITGKDGNAVQHGKVSIIK